MVMEKKIMKDVGSVDDIGKVQVDPHSLNRLTFPWLLISDDNKKGRLVFFNLKENRFYLTKAIVEFHKKYVWQCMDGWLVLEDYMAANINYLFNLSSMQKLELPPLKEICDSYRSYILSAPPTDPMCRVIVINGCNHRLFHCQPGANEFTQESIVIEGSLLPIMTAIAFNGSIYGLTLDLELVISSFMNPSLFTLISDWQSFYFSGAFRPTDNLVVLGDDLILVRFHYTGYKNYELFTFLIYRADFSQKAWMKMEDIGEYAILLDQNQGLACKTTGLGFRRNCIYYSRPDDKNLHIFDLEDKSLTLSSTSSITSRWSNLYWCFLPRSLPIFDASIEPYATQTPQS